MKHILLFFLFLSILGFSQCPPDGTFTSQAEIDAFSTDYPDCTILGVSLIISGDNITDLSGLGQIEACTGLGISNNLVLQNTDGLNANIVLSAVEGTGNGIGISNNASLLEVTGLENLVNQSDFGSGFNISNNPMLISIEGVPILFNNLNYFTISNNDALINLIGLENYFSGEITSISDNDSLIDLTGLPSILGTEVITISNNDALESFNGLITLGSDAFYIIIENNAVLADINIANGDSIGYSPTITIQNNPNLSVCSANWVCAFLYSSGVEEREWFPGTFVNNAPGCNSNIEVEYGCELNSNDDCGYADVSNYLVLGETITANNEFATTSTEVPSCNEIPNRKDLWFAFNSEDNTTIDLMIETGYNLQLWQGLYCHEMAQVESACGGEVLDDVIVIPNTSYFVQVWNDDSTGRTESGWFNLTVQDGTLSTKNFQYEDVKIFPNPVNDVLNILSNVPIDKVEIFNLLCQKIKNLNLNSITNTVDMSNLNDGLYLIQISANGKTSTYKVLKK